MSCLEILPIRPMDIKDEKEYHPNLPSIKRNAGSINLLIGSTACGKTTAISNLILSKHFWGGKEPAFDKIFVFSPSLYVDDSCRFLREFCECYSDFKDSYLKDILDAQEMFEKKDMPKILIVLDDAVGMISRNNNINAFLSRYRHWNCNVIMSVQHMKSISPIGRNNATNILLFNGIVNHKEWENINEEWGNQYKGSLERMYHKFANKKYAFLHLDIRKNPARLFLNFTKELDWEKYVPKKMREKLLEMEKDADEMDEEVI